MGGVGLFGVGVKGKDRMWGSRPNSKQPSTHPRTHRARAALCPALSQQISQPTRLTPRGLLRWTLLLALLLLCLRQCVTRRRRRRCDESRVVGGWSMGREGLRGLGAVVGGLGVRQAAAARIQTPQNLSTPKHNTNPLPPAAGSWGGVELCGLQPGWFE